MVMMMISHGRVCQIWRSWEHVNVCSFCMVWKCRCGSLEGCLKSCFLSLQKWGFQDYICKQARQGKHGTPTNDQPNERNRRTLKWRVCSISLGRSLVSLFWSFPLAAMVQQWATGISEGLPPNPFSSPELHIRWTKLIWLQKKVKAGKCYVILEALTNIPLAVNL